VISAMATPAYRHGYRPGGDPRTPDVHPNGPDRKNGDHTGPVLRGQSRVQPQEGGAYEFRARAAARAAAGTASAISDRASWSCAAETNQASKADGGR